MNRWTGFAAVLIVLAGCVLSPHRVDAASEEDNLLRILQSDRPAGEKGWACRRLRIVGTARAVPVLASFLTDKELSHSARYALESMPYPEAGAALREALGKATGKTKAGIIDSLGHRRDRGALPALTELARDPDPQVASSAAAALGKIGGPQAVQALRAAKPKAPSAVRPVVADALLLCADQLLAAGYKKGASAIYKETYDSEKPEHVRTAAFRGLVLAAGDDAIALVRKALTGSDRASRFAALQLVREIKGQAATKAFAALLPKVAPRTQVALLEALRQRGDAAATPAIISATKSPAQAVRVAALKALATLGDASTAPLLAEAAARAKGAEQGAARQSLLRLRGANVREAILAHLAKARPAVQMELARALGHRRDTLAVPALLKMAAGADESVRMAAIRSLALLADEKAVGELVGHLVRAKTEADREAIEKALGSVCGRSKRPEACAAPVLAALKDARVPARCALLRVAGRVGGAEALKALRAGIRDKDPALRDAAIRTMADASGLEAAPDLLKLAREAPSPSHRVLALRGYWRLVGLAGGRPVEERWKMCEAAMAAARRPEEKKLGLTELAKVPHFGALKLAQTLCADAAIRAEAEAACVRIAASLGQAHPAEAKAALRRIMAASKNVSVRAEAGKALEAMEQYVGYIPTWMVAGPYRQKGKECRELFDIAFAPEGADAAKVTWKPAPSPSDASLFWQVDLSSVVGGNHCVVYLRTRVYAPRKQRVRLDIGTDDGIKMWVNGKLVHANNAVRGLRPGQDRAEAVLREGWNAVLVKITQHTMGCGACVRIRNSDGSVIQGLRFDSGGADAPKAGR